MLKILKRGIPQALFFFGFFAPALFAAERPSEQIQRELVTQTDFLKKQPARPPQLLKPAIIEEKKKDPPPGDSGISFYIDKVVIVGNTLFPTPELEILAHPFEHQRVSMEDLGRLSQMIAGYYRQRGYATTYAYVPPQKILDKKVKLQILEGRVGAVSVEGNRWFQKRLYQKAMSLNPGDFLDMGELEKAVREINRQPDRSVRAYLQAGQEPGETDVVLKAKDQFPIHASYEFNLRGTKTTHRDRHILHLTDNNFLGQGDRLESSLSLAQQGAILGSAFNYEYGIVDTGTSLRFAASVAKSRLQRDFRALHIGGRSFSLLPGVTQKIWQGSHVEVDGAAQFEIKDSMTRQGDDKISYDRMRVFTAGPRIRTYDAWGQTSSAVDLHVGIPDFMGGSKRRDSLASRVNSGGQFAYGTVNIARVQRLPYEALMIFQASGQYSSSPLTSLEQMNLGGMSSVRGYPENDQSGDHGYSASAELRLPSYLIPKDWTLARLGMKDKTWREAFSLVGFLEGGQLFNYKHQREGDKRTHTLVGTGFGARFYISPDLSFQFDLGFPIGESSSDKDRPQAHLSLRVGF